MEFSVRVSNVSDLPPSAPRRELEQLVAALYDELHAVAARAMRRERGSHTLQPTAILHEAYMRLANQRQAGWSDEREFLAVAANVMRRVLVDHARRRAAGKRGAGAARVTLDPERMAASESGVDLLGLDDALERLAADEPRAARVVELRFFAGLSVEETAAALGVSVPTVKRDWAWARTWLYSELEGADAAVP